MNTKIHLTPSQGEKLRELGSYLQEIRLKRSLSLDDISKKTRIQVRLLKAIEEAQTDVLPEPVYIRALIKQFADALELNGSDFASAFPTQYHVRTIKPAWRTAAPSQLRPLHLYWIYIAILVSAMSGLSVLVQRSNPEIAQQDQESSLSQEIAQSSPASQPSTIKAVNRLEAGNKNRKNSDNPAKPEEKVVVSMTFQEDCWLKVVADGSVAYEGTLSKGEQRTWQAEKSLEITAGNAGGVVIAINNQEAKPLGSPGTVQTVTYRPSNPQS